MGEQKHRSNVGIRIVTGGVAALMLICGIAAVRVKQMSPSVEPRPASITMPTEQTAVSWPSQGQFSIGGAQGGVLSESESQTPTPTASVAKVMTALLLLQKFPMQPGEDGKNFVIARRDVASYYDYLAKNGSTVPVITGESLSEKQVLEALLLPSANNVADSAAIWAYGSMPEYLQAANLYAKKLGMNSSVFADDASGFSPRTKSTAHDLVLLGQAALKEPVIKNIVAKSTATIPVAGVVRNVNSLVGSNGVVGIKTGNTIEAGGCFLYAVTRDVGGQSVTLISAVTRSHDLEHALKDSQALMESAFNNTSAVRVLSKGDSVATYQTDWGTSLSATAKDDIYIPIWKGRAPKISTQLPAVQLKKLGSFNGHISVDTGIDSKTSKLILTGDTSTPSLGWRLRHLFQ